MIFHIGNFRNISINEKLRFVGVDNDSFKKEFQIINPTDFPDEIDAIVYSLGLCYFRQKGELDDTFRSRIKKMRASMKEDERIKKFIHDATQNRIGLKESIDNDTF